MTAAALVAVGLLLCAILNRPLAGLFATCANVALDHVLPRVELAAAWCLRRLCWTPEARLAGRLHRGYAAADQGRSQVAARDMDAALRRARALSPAVCDWGAVHGAVDTYVNAGLYARALAACEAWPAEARRAGRAGDEGSYTDAQVNRAEALHNLGRDGDALRLLAEVEAGCGGQPLALNGLRLLRCWILAHDGRAQDAAREVRLIDPGGFGRRYTAEYHYVRSAIARELGDLDDAEDQARRGLASARRASSKRNGLSVLAAVALARGDAAAALPPLQAFARHPYRPQAARGLALLAVAQRRLGRRADADLTCALVRERDPESRLTGSPPPTTPPAAAAATDGNPFGRPASP